MLRRFTGFLVLCALATAAFCYWTYHELGTPYLRAGSAGTFVDIPRGATARMIADLLAEAGVLNYRIPFILYLRWTGAGPRLEAGEYLFEKPATPHQIVERLLRGDVYFRTITIPEGLTARESIELIARSNLAKAEELARMLTRTEWVRDVDPQAQTLEGYLFPDTYRFPRNAGAEQIVKSMVVQFREKMRKIRAAHPMPAGWTLRRIVTLASIIEKEVKIPQERAVVASVMNNRLQKGIPLACDPTLIYALKLAGKYDGNITKAHLSMESVYNTYIHVGLPPSPIANPGAESLIAALSPAKSDYMYYVSRNDGSHQFSRDYRAHQLAVDRYQKHLGR